MPAELPEREVVMVAFFKQMLVSRRWEDRFGAINGILATVQKRAQCQAGD